MKCETCENRSSGRSDLQGGPRSTPATFRESTFLFQLEWTALEQIKRLHELLTRLQHPYEPCQTFLDRLRAFFAALLERKADLQHQSLMMRLTFKQNDQSKNAHERDRRMLVSSYAVAFKWWKGKHGAARLAAVRLWCLSWWPSCNSVATGSAHSSMDSQTPPIMRI